MNDVLGGEEEVGWSCVDQLSCERLEELEPPPDFLQMVPPPPVPEFMEEYVERLHQASGECLLCNWAKNNGSVPLVGPDSGTSSSWIPILIVVALLSALLGAVIMIVLIKCRRWRVLPSKGLCPLTAMGRTKEAHSAPGGGAKSLAAGRGQGMMLPACAAHGGQAPAGWGRRLWNRSPSQEQQLRSPGSGGDSPCCCSEAPYTLPDQESAVYAELNSVAASQGVPAYRTYMMNTYSEICDPGRLLPDGTYENAPPPPGGDSGGSNPSSAYYSDISGGEPTAACLHHGSGSQRRQRRRRGDPPLSPSERLPVISAPILAHTPRGALLFPHHVPVPVNLLPEPDLPENMENPPPESTVIATTRRGSRYSRAAPAGGGDLCDEYQRHEPPAGPSDYPLQPQLTPLRRDQSSSFRSDPDSGQRSGDSGNRSGSEQSSLDRRPLPLLPSRRVQGPQKRGVYTLTSQSELPRSHSSEYV